MASTQVTVTGEHVEADGTAMSGTVYWTPAEPMDQTGDNKTYCGETTATLSGDGSWTLTVPANDDSDVNVTTYDVRFNLTGSNGSYRRKFSVSISAGNGASQRWEDL